MSATRSLSRLAGRQFMRGKPGMVCDTSPVLLGVADFDGKLTFVNPAWEKMLGYPAQELLNRPLRDLMQHEPPAAVTLVERLLARGNLDAMQFGLRCQDGTCKWFLWHRRYDSEHEAIFIAGYDITEQKTREISSILRSYGRRKTGTPSPI